MTTAPANSWPFLFLQNVLSSVNPLFRFFPFQGDVSLETRICQLRHGKGVTQREKRTKNKWEVSQVITCLHYGIPQENLKLKNLKSPRLAIIRLFPSENKLIFSLAVFVWREGRKGLKSSCPQRSTKDCHLSKEALPLRHGRWGRIDGTVGWGTPPTSRLERQDCVNLT